MLSLVIFVAILAVFILWRPYLGIVFIAASLPLIDILPQVPFLTSAFPLIGAITFLGFIFHKLKEPMKPLFRFGSTHLLGLAFIGWIFVSNPQAAWSGVTRNWILTFFQLWVLILLTGELLDTPRKHQIFMWVFSIATVASALLVVQQGAFHGSISSYWRIAGLTDGANSAARYFVVGMVFLLYLSTITNKRSLQLFAKLGVVLTFLGVFFTISRTGIILLFAAFGLYFLIQPQRKNRTQLIILFVFSIVALWFLADGVVSILKSIIPSITQAADTIGLRYQLWNAGYQMWLDHILQGVGIGMYPIQLGVYAQGLVHPYYLSLGLVTHNMYIQMLAETGIVGFVLFMLLLMNSLISMWPREKEEDTQIISLKNSWLIVFLIMLLGGITKSDHIDKLIWLTMGIGVTFRNLMQAKTQHKKTYKLPGHAPA